MDAFYSASEKPDEKPPMLYNQVLQYNANILTNVVQNYKKQTRFLSVIHSGDAASTFSLLFRLPTLSSCFVNVQKWCTVCVSEKESVCLCLFVYLNSSIGLSNVTPSCVCLALIDRDATLLRAEVVK